MTTTTTTATRGVNETEMEYEECDCSCAPRLDQRRLSWFLEVLSAHLFAKILFGRDASKAINMTEEVEDELGTPLSRKNMWAVGMRACDSEAWLDLCLLPCVRACVRAWVCMCVCVCVGTSATKRTQGFCNNLADLAYQLIECAKISSISYCILAGACGTHVLPHATKLWT